MDDYTSRLPCWAAAMIMRSNSIPHQLKESWKGELKKFSSKNGYDISRNGDIGPLLLDMLEGFLKYESLTKSRGSERRDSERDSVSSEPRNICSPVASVAGGLPPLGRTGSGSLVSDGRAGSSSSSSNYRKDEYNNWRSDNDELPDGIFRASAALEDLQLDRKARNLTSSWRHVGDGISEEGGRLDHI